MPIYSQFQWLEKKQALIIARNKTEGITTTFAIIARKDTENSFKDNEFVDYEKHAKAFNEASLAGDQNYIYQLNSTDQNTIPYANLDRAQKDDSSKINMQLRMLCTTRSIDYLLEQRAALYPQHKEFYNEQRDKLAESFDTFLNNPSQTELEYAQTLIRTIQRCGLDQGLNQSKASEYEELLEHYRIKEAQLDPGTILESTYFDKSGRDEAKIVQTVAVPITVKTDAQKQSLEKQKTLALHAQGKETNAHAGQKAAHQEIDVAYSNKVALDNRYSGPQDRQYEAVGTKNGYIVHSAIQKVKEVSSGKPVTRISAQSASAVYVGTQRLTIKGIGDIWRFVKTYFSKKYESEDEIQKQTQENLKQVNNAMSAMTGDGQAKISIIQLVTRYFWNHEKSIVEHTQEAAENLDIQYNNIGVNVPGQVVSNTYAAPNLFARIMNFFDRGLVFGQAKSYYVATKIAFQNVLEKVRSYISCASGCDRTNELQTNLDIELAVNNEMGSRAEIEEIYAKQAHAPHLTSTANAGSNGVKHESNANLYGETLTDSMHRPDADTNKALKFDKKSDVFLEPESVNESIKDDICNAPAVDKHVRNILDEMPKAGAELKGGKFKHIAAIESVEVLLAVHQQLLTLNMANPEVSYHLYLKFWSLRDQLISTYHAMDNTDKASAKGTVLRENINTTHDALRQDKRVEQLLEHAGNASGVAKLVVPSYLEFGFYGAKRREEMQPEATKTAKEAYHPKPNNPK